MMTSIEYYNLNPQIYIILCAVCFALITIFVMILFIRIVQVERGSPNSMCLVESGRVSYFFCFCDDNIYLVYSHLYYRIVLQNV